MDPLSKFVSQYYYTDWPSTVIDKRIETSGLRYPKFLGNSSFYYTTDCNGPILARDSNFEFQDMYTPTIVTNTAGTLYFYPTSDPSFAKSFLDGIPSTIYVCRCGPIFSAKFNGSAHPCIN